MKLQDKDKIQIFIIHGGMTFKSHSDYLNYLKTREISVQETVKWTADYLKDYLNKASKKSFEIIKPRMPLSENAKYEEWKIHFERHLPYFRDNIILIGISLGGIFLAKYLSEHQFPKKILSTYLISPPFDDSLSDEDLVGGFELGSNLSLLEQNSPNLKLLFSRDDDVVPVAHAEKYRAKLKHAKIIIYKSKNGHFRISKFPEIIRMIRKDIILKE
jgi:predicted alpha/beta hydrolase family esterase